MRFLGPSLSLLVLLTAADASAADVVRKVKDIWPGAGSAFFEPEGQGVAVGGHVFFRAVSPETPGALSGPSEVWTTDGTEAGTSLLVPRGPSAPGWPTSSAIAGGVAFFTDASGLWKTDGTTAGTSLVHALGNAAGSRLVAGNGRVFFTVGGPGGTNTVWTSDGTAAGTKPLAGGPIATVELVAAGARVVAVGYAPATGTELWASDAALTSLDVIEIAPGSVSSQPRELTAFGGKAYFFTAGGPDAHGRGEDAARGRAATDRVRVWPLRGRRRALLPRAHRRLRRRGVAQRRNAGRDRAPEGRHARRERIDAALREGVRRGGAVHVLRSERARR